MQLSRLLPSSLFEPHTKEEVGYVPCMSEWHAYLPPFCLNRRILRKEIMQRSSSVTLYILSHSPRGHMALSIAFFAYPPMMFSMLINE